MNAYRSLSLSTFSFTASDIALLHKLSGIIESGPGIFSSVTFVGDGGGGIDTRSTKFSGVFVWVILAFFGCPSSAPASTNLWNWVSTGTLFVVESSIMLRDLDSSSSSSFDDSTMIRLHLPFPCCRCCVFNFFLAAAISFEFGQCVQSVSPPTQRY